MTESNRHYLINMVDGRVILYTKQAVRQINYHPISPKIALAVTEKRIDWKDVVSRIKANLINNQDAWDDLLKKKTTMNTRKTVLNTDDSEGSETIPEDKDVGEEFDMPVNGETADKGDKPKAEGNKSGKPGRARGNRDSAPKPEDAAPKPEDAAPKPETDKAPDGDDLQDDLENL